MELYFYVPYRPVLAIKYIGSDIMGIQFVR